MGLRDRLKIYVGASLIAWDLDYDVEGAGFANGVQHCTELRDDVFTSVVMG